MFREILKIIPKLDEADLDKMARSLNKRFERVAKSFGKGIMSALKGGGVVGLAAGLIEKLLNPFDEIKKTIDEALGRADDIKTYADQFNTTSGNLFKLQTLAQAKGLDNDSLRNLIGKFQGAVAEAIADPSKQTSVRQFAKPGQDTTEAFFQYIQGLNKLSPDQKVLAQQEIFGEKQSLKAAEFLNEKDFAGLALRLGLAKGNAYTPIINRGSDLADKNDEFAAIRARQHLEESLPRISESMVVGKNAADALIEQDQRGNLAKFDKAKAASQTMDALTKALQDIIFSNGDLNKTLKTLESTLSRIPGLKGLRGVDPFGKKGD
jgi:hypothetical protein